MRYVRQPIRPDGLRQVLRPNSRSEGGTTVPGVRLELPRVTPWRKSPEKSIEYPTEFPVNIAGSTRPFKSPCETNAGPTFEINEDRWVSELSLPGPREGGELKSPLPLRVITFIK